MTAFPQSDPEGISSVEARDALDRLYGVDQRLVSGDFYYGAKRGSITGHPYFIDSERKKGSVVIEGIRFDDLELRYDILENIVVLRFFPLNSASVEISLKNENIDFFEMDGQLFVPFIWKNNLNGLWFCQKLVDDEVSYLLHRVKWLDLNSGVSSSDFEYKTNEKQFILVNGELYGFSGKKTLYKLFPEIRKDLRDYKRRKKLSLRKSRITNRVDFVNHCNTLLKQGR